VIRDHPIGQSFTPSFAITYGVPLRNAVGLIYCGSLWGRLHVLIFEGYLWYDKTLDPMTVGFGRRRLLSLSDWSFRVLVVRFHPAGRGKEKPVVDLFLDVDLEDQPTFLTATGRIELSGGPSGMEEQFRNAVEEKKRVGLSAFEERIASMIVFVDEDDTERRRLEEQEQ